MPTYDLIIVGSGQGGSPLAADLAKAGKNVALIEQKYVGGTCINVGCTPTKTMVASAQVAEQARRVSDYGVHDGKVSIDMRQVVQRKNRTVESFRSGSRTRIEKAGVHLIKGQAHFSGKKTLQVFSNEDGRSVTLNAETIIINAGARPAVPHLDGLQRVPFLDSTSIMELDNLPDHLLILGGGYIAVEFGQMFRRFGSQVTIVQKGPQLLGREDDDIAKAMADILREDGIQIIFNADAQQVSKNQDNQISMKIKTDQGEQTLAGSHLLIGVGRTPNSDTLNLPAAGIRMDERGNICTDEFLQTNQPGVYAIGDIKGGPAFTHISYDDYRVLKANLLGGEKASIRGRMVPYTVFTDPQLGRVGLTESEAKAKGYDYQAVQMLMSSVARAIEIDQTRGLMKAIVDKGTKQILGAAILGVEGGEVMAMVEIAMMGKLPYTALRDGIFAHPTLAESFNNLFASLP